MRVTSVGTVLLSAAVAAADLAKPSGVKELLIVQEPESTFIRIPRPTRTIDVLVESPSIIPTTNIYGLSFQLEEEQRGRGGGIRPRPGSGAAGQLGQQLGKGAFGLLNGLANGLSNTVKNGISGVAALLPRPGSFGSFFPSTPSPTPKNDQKGPQTPSTPRPPPGSPLGKDNKSKPPIKPGHEAQCTKQEINCAFVRESAYQLQNDDDDCLKLATSFDAEGKIKFEPIAQDQENVIYGLTTDGLTASAWCNDVGWALRKIYINCRRGNKCYGGSAYAARNSVFLVTVGPRVDSPAPDNKSSSNSKAENKATPSSPS